MYVPRHREYLASFVSDIIALNVCHAREIYEPTDAGKVSANDLYRSIEIIDIAPRRIGSEPDLATMEMWAISPRPEGRKSKIPRAAVLYRGFVSKNHC